MNRKVVWIVVAVIIIAVIIGFTSKNDQKVSSTSEPIKIGAALALTGDAAPWGEESLKAAKLAVDEINASGGIKGKKLELVVEDMKSSTAGGVSAVSKLVSIDKVKAVMITWLDSYAGAESPLPSNMLMISQDAAIESVNVPVNHPNVFSLWYRTSSKAEVTMFEMKKAGVKKLYVVLQNDSYYVKLLEFLKAEASKQGIMIVDEELLATSDDARTTIAKISNLKPDAVFFGSYDEKLSVNFLKRYSEVIRASIALYGDEFIEQDLANSNFKSTWLEGIVYYVPATPDSKFVAKFEQKYGHKPMFSAATTYDTVNVLAAYLGENPKEVAQYMKNTEFDTITYGRVRFDEIGGVVADKSAIMMKKIMNGNAIEIK